LRVVVEVVDDKEWIARRDGIRKEKIGGGENLQEEEKKRMKERRLKVDDVEGGE